MSKFNVQVNHIPILTEYQTGIAELFTEIFHLKPNHLFLWDSTYYYVSHTDWGKVIKKVLLDMPRYTAQKFDCENFAMLTCARTAEIFKLNTMGVAIGQSPMGYHGFNIFKSELGLFYLEPQTGMVHGVNEDSGYKAEIVILG